MLAIDLMHLFFVSGVVEVIVTNVLKHDHCTLTQSIIQDELECIQYTSDWARVIDPSLKHMKGISCCALCYK